MFKKLIASIAALGLCTGLLANANINKVNAEGTSSASTTDTTSDSVTLTKLYYFDFTNTDYVQKMKENNGYYYPTCLNTGNVDNNYSFSFDEVYEGYAEYENIKSNVELNCSGTSIDKYNSMTTFKNAFNFSHAYYMYLSIPDDVSFNISFNFVTSKVSDISIRNPYGNGVSYNEIKYTNAKSNNTQSLTIENSNITKMKNKYQFSNFSMIGSDNIDVEIAEILITVEEESSSVTAKAFIQDGSNVTNDSSMYYQRFITIVDGVTSVYDLYNVEYKLTYTYKDNDGNSQTVVTSDTPNKNPKPHVVDEILKGTEAYTTKIYSNSGSTDYTFNSKDSTKYLVYTVSNAKSTTTDGVTTWAYDFSGIVKLEIVLNGKTISSTNTTINAKHTA